MNGLINQAVEQLFTSLKGEASWRGVCAHAGVAADGFVSRRSYDDDITYRLVNSVSEYLRITPEQVLEALGELWVTFTVQAGYEDVMTATGSNLREFLVNVNETHGRIEVIFDGLRMPFFRVEDVSDTEYRLFYASERDGLAPMVLGLVKGSARRFGQPVEVVQVYAKTEIGGEDIFNIRHLAS